MSAGASKDMRLTVRKLRKQGFVVTHTRNGHLRVESPDGGAVQVSSSPGSASGYRTQVARLRRIGYEPARKAS